MRFVHSENIRELIMTGRTYLGHISDYTRKKPRGAFYKGFCKELDILGVRADVINSRAMWLYDPCERLRDGSCNNSRLRAAFDKMEGKKK